jgi:hypothetical protein
VDELIKKMTDDAVEPIYNTAEANLPRQQLLHIIPCTSSTVCTAAGLSYFLKDGSWKI